MTELLDFWTPGLLQFWYTLLISQQSDDATYEHGQDGVDLKAQGGDEDGHAEGDAQ